LVISQITLLSQWFSKKNLVKKFNKNNQPKRPNQKWSSPKLVQNGISVKLDKEEKNHIWGVFFIEIPNQKSCDFL